MTEKDYLYCYVHMALDDEELYKKFDFNENFNLDEFIRKSGAYDANF